MEGQFLPLSYSHGFHICQWGHACVRSNSDPRPQSESSLAEIASLAISTEQLHTNTGHILGCFLGGAIPLVLCHWVC